MRKLSAVAYSLAFALFVGAGLAHAQVVSGLPLAALAGNWAGQGTATFSLCFNSDFSSVVDCSEAANTAFFNQVNLIQATLDTKGNFCQTNWATNSIEFPFPPSPANNITDIQVGKTVSYNQATETGTNSVTSYVAGPGTSCNGSVFVNTANAAPVNVVTGTFAISQFGRRSDFIVQTIQEEPISDIDNFVGSGYINRQ